MANFFSVTVKRKALRMKSDWCIKLSRTQETKVPRPCLYMQVYQLCMYMCTSGEVDGKMHCVLYCEALFTFDFYSGIWIRDIRIQSNLGLTQVNKVLKVLESKKLIKAVKSVQASKKKVYMLFDLVPDESVTGGAWYCDQDFETEFVDVLNQHCLKFLQQKVCSSKRL